MESRVVVKLWPLLEGTPGPQVDSCLGLGVSYWGLLAMMGQCCEFPGVPQSTSKYVVLNRDPKISFQS